MQVRRDKNPLVVSELKIAYAISYTAFHDCGQLALGASFVIATDQDSAERYTHEKALTDLPPEDGYYNHHVAVFPIPGDWLLDAVEECTEPPQPQSSLHQRDLKANANAQSLPHPRNLEIRTLEDSPTCSVCDRRAVTFDESVYRWRCERHPGGKR